MSNLVELEESFCIAAKQLFKIGQSELRLKGLIRLALDEAQEEMDCDHSKWHGTRPTCPTCGCSMS